MTSIDSNNPGQVQDLEGARRLDLVYELLDELHSAICAGRWQQFADFESSGQLISWLKEVSYIAQESISELEANREQATPELRILDKPIVPVAEERAE